MGAPSKPYRASWRLPTGPPGPLQTSPPCPGAVVKMEDGWAQSPPVPAACQLGKWTRSPSATSSPGDDGDAGGIRVPRWGPAARGEAWVVCSSPHEVSSPPARFCPPMGKERVQSSGEDLAGALEQAAPSLSHILPNQALAQEALRSEDLCSQGFPNWQGRPLQPPGWPRPAAGPRVQCVSFSRQEQRAAQSPPQ